MEIDYFQVLEYLKSMKALNKRVSLSPLIMQSIPIKPLTYQEATKLIVPVIKLIRKMKADNNVEYDPFGKHNVHSANSFNWEIMTSIEVELTTKGYSELNEHLQNEFNSKINQSVLETNSSVKDTNKSIVATNSALVANSINQSTTLRKQTKIFWFTAAFALGSLIVSTTTLILDKQKQQLQKELKILSTDKDKAILKIIHLKADSARLQDSIKAFAKHHK